MIIIIKNQMEPEVEYDNTLMVITNNNKLIGIPIDIISYFGLFIEIIEENGINQNIPLPNIDDKLLNIIVQLCLLLKSGNFKIPDNNLDSGIIKSMVLNIVDNTNIKEFFKTIEKDMYISIWNSANYLDIFIIKELMAYKLSKNLSYLNKLLKNKDNHEGIIYSDDE